MRYLLLSRRNIFLAISTAFLLFFILIPQFVFKTQFLYIKNVIEDTLSNSIGKAVHVEGIRFLPYGVLILRNIRIYDKENNIAHLDIKKCHLQFEVLPLVFRKEIVVSRVTFVEPVFYPSFKPVYFVGDQHVYLRGGHLGKYRLKFPKSIFVRLVSGRFTLTSHIGWINFSLSARLRKWPIHNNVLAVDRMVLDFEQFKLLGEGTIKDYNIDPVFDIKIKLKEFSFPERVYSQAKLFITAIHNFVLHIKGRAREQSYFISMAMLRSKFSYLPAVLKVDNFYCDMHISKDEFLVKDMACFLNDFPVGAKARIFNFKSSNPKIEFNLMSYPGQIESLRPFNPLNFEISFSGYKDKDAIKGDVSFQTQKIISIHPRQSYNVEFSMEDLVCRFLVNPFLLGAEKESAYLSVSADNISYEFNMPEASVSLKGVDFKASVSLKLPRAYLPDFKLSAYGGLLRGKGVLDFYKLPPKVLFNFRFDKLDMLKLIELFNLDYEVSGDLSGNAIFNNRMGQCLIGQAVVANGYVKDMKALELIADFLGVNSIKDVYFEELSSGFCFSNKDKELYCRDIKLHNEDIDLDANIRLKDSKKINGNIVVRLSTKLLRESFNLKLLFFFIGERLPYEDFEFEIAGFVKSPRVKWLSTKFKQSVMKYLSNRGEDALEKQAEEAINQLIKSK